VIYEVFVKPMLGERTEEIKLAGDIEKCGRLLTFFQNQLKDNKFVVSDEISLADLFFAPPLSYLLQFPDGIRYTHRAQLR